MYEHLITVLSYLKRVENDIHLQSPFYIIYCQHAICPKSFTVISRPKTRHSMTTDATSTMNIMYSYYSSMKVA